ncbi:MAG: AAA family ATPase [Actinobacteria bacterium]|nr:MAG: AAA family ATPase [Actinomycetota bacterium]
MSVTKLNKDLEHLNMQAAEVIKVESSAWDSIAGMKAQKEIIEKKILLPLTNKKLAKKHGVTLPKALLLFGPPGTGKTSFTKGIAGKLGWSLVEISPSELVTEGLHFEAQQLKQIFSQLNGLKNIVVFIDEFEELAINAEKATKAERMLSNEMLKQIPQFRKNEQVLLVCATNHIHHLNSALLRPGRFDFILPIGPLDKEAASAVISIYLEKINHNTIDLELVAEKAKNFTPADIESVIAQVAQSAFEKELSSKHDYKVSTQDILKYLSIQKPTINKEDMELFQKQIKEYGRCASGCIYCFTGEGQNKSCNKEVEKLNSNTRI